MILSVKTVVIADKSDLFRLLLTSKYKRENGFNFQYIYNDNNYYNRSDHIVMKTSLDLFSKKSSNIILSNRKTDYKIFDGHVDYVQLKNIIHNKSIHKPITKEDISLNNNRIYTIEDTGLSKKYLNDILDIYYGVVDSNCYVAFNLNNKMYYLTKSFEKISYKQNGKMCLYVNYEYWKYD